VSELTTTGSRGTTPVGPITIVAPSARDLRADLEAAGLRVLEDRRTPPTLLPRIVVWTEDERGSVGKPQAPRGRRSHPGALARNLCALCPPGPPGPDLDGQPRVGVIPLPSRLAPGRWRHQAGAGDDRATAVSTPLAGPSPLPRLPPPSPALYGGALPRLQPPTAPPSAAAHRQSALATGPARARADRGAQGDPMPTFDEYTLTHSAGRERTLRMLELCARGQGGPPDARPSRSYDPIVFVDPLARRGLGLDTPPAASAPAGGGAVRGGVAAARPDLAGPAIPARGPGPVDPWSCAGTPPTLVPTPSRAPRPANDSGPVPRVSEDASDPVRQGLAIYLAPTVALLVVLALGLLGLYVVTGSGPIPVP